MTRSSCSDISESSLGFISRCMSRQCDIFHREVSKLREIDRASINNDVNSIVQRNDKINNEFQLSHREWHLAVFCDLPIIFTRYIEYILFVHRDRT